MSDITNQSFTIITGANGDDDDWCSDIHYREVDICQVMDYIHRNRVRGCCFPPAFFFGLSPTLCCKGTWPIPTDVGVSKSLPVLPLGYHYAQVSTDSKFGRALQGIFAKDRGKIYLAPYIQSTETVLVKWDGIKRTWADSDPIDEDPLLLEAVVEFVRWKHEDKWGKDREAQASALEAFTIARVKLVRQCREETRIRNCEPSLARSSPGTLFYNEQQTATATCPDGQTGAAITEIIPSGTVASNKSVADANAIAKKQAIAQATARLTCVPTPVTYWNTPQTYVATCAQTEGAPIPDGDSVTITIPANSYSSTVSQDDANAQALAAATTQANDGLSCTWWNAEQSFTASCPQGSSGSDVTRTTQVHTKSSSLSQSDADSQAINAAKVAAEDALVCSGSPTVYHNTQQIAFATRTRCGYRPPRFANGILIDPGNPGCNVSVTVTCLANRFSSTASQNDANQQALNYAQNYANSYALAKCSQVACGDYQITLP